MVELNNNHASKSVSLNASFWSRKVRISSAYNINYYIQTMTHESHARLTELCSIGRANRLLALLVELNVDLLRKYPQ